MSSTTLASLIERADAAELGLHSVTIVRSGVMVLDATFFPYDGTRAHDIASCTKSLTSLAIGSALSDGLIAGLDQPLVDLLPGAEPADPRARATTLRHALTMTAGLGCDMSPGEPSLLAMQRAPNWIRFALDLPIQAEPGTTWTYCSVVSHLVSAAAGQATGTSTDVWMRERVLGPLGVSEVLWPRDPQGVSHGWGDARMFPEDMARVGLLMLHQGRWDSAVLLDPAWVGEATRDEVAGPEAYGHQWWVGEDGSFYANGRGGQYIWVHPEHELIVVTTGSMDAARAGELGGLLREALLPSIVSDGPLPPDAEGTARLQDALAAAHRAPDPEPLPALPATAAVIAGRSFATPESPVGWTSFAFSFEGLEAQLAIEMEGETSVLAIGLDGVSRITRGARVLAGARYADLDVALEGRWIDGNRFEVAFDTIDRIDAGTLTFAFEGDEAEIDLYERTYQRTHVVFSASAD